MRIKIEFRNGDVIYHDCATYTLESVARNIGTDELGERLAFISYENVNGGTNIKASVWETEAPFTFAPPYARLDVVA